MLGWIGDIEQATLDNETFRTVLFTGDHTQLTVMRLAPGERTSDVKRIHISTSSFGSNGERAGSN
jgi:hypothetical protein